MPPMMMNPYKPVSPVGSPMFPIEPRASTMPPPRAPTLPGGKPHTSPSASMDFLTQVGREGSVPQLLASGALNAATSVNRDTAREVEPLRQDMHKQAQQEQQRNALLAAIETMRSRLGPAEINQPSPPTWTSLGNWLADNYPQFEGKTVPKELGKRIRAQHLEAQAAKFQAFDTQMRGYGAQMRGRTPFRPVAAGELLKDYYRPGVDPAIRKRELEDREAKYRREDVVTKGERTFKRDQAKAKHARAMELAEFGKPAVVPEKLLPKQAITRAVLAKDWETVEDLLTVFPQPKDAEGKDALAFLRQAVSMLNGIKRGRGEFSYSTPQDRLLEEGLERKVGDAFGIDVAAPQPGAIDKVGEEMREGVAAPAALPPAAPTAAPPTAPGAPPASRISEMAQWYFSLSDEEKSLFSTQVKKGPGGQ